MLLTSVDIDYAFKQFGVLVLTNTGMLYIFYEGIRNYFPLHSFHSLDSLLVTDVA